MNERQYKLKKYPPRMPFDDAILLDYEDVFQHYEVVGISITGWLNKTLWVLYKKKSDFKLKCDNDEVS